MANAIRAWFERHLSDPQVIGLAAVLVGGFAIIWLGGGMLAPVIASIVIAYLLEGLIGVLERNRVPRLAAVLVVFVAFMTTLLFVMFGLLPLLSRQATQLLQQLPVDDRARPGSAARAAAYLPGPVQRAAGPRPHQPDPRRGGEHRPGCRPGIAVLRCSESSRCSST